MACRPVRGEPSIYRFKAINSRIEGGAARSLPLSIETTRLGNMQLQFGLLRSDLVISNGVEAWILRGGRWKRTDALTAFLKSTQLTPREARRTFGHKLPDVPPEAFAGRKVGPRGLSRWGPRIGRARSL